MEQHRLSAAFFSVALVAQAAFLARGITVSFWLVLIWAIVVYIFVLEGLYPAWRNSRLIKQLVRTPSAKMTVAVVAAIVIAGTVFFPYWRYPGITLEHGNVTRGIHGDTWLRIRVANDGVRDAKCRAYLISLFKDGGNVPIAVEIGGQALPALSR